MNRAILNVGFKYGAISGVLSVLLFFAVVLLGDNPLLATKWFDYVVTPVFIYLAVKEFKRYENGGFLLFWQGASVGFVTYVVSGLIFILVAYGYLSTAGEVWMADYRQHQVELLEENREGAVEEMGEANYARALQNLPNESVAMVLGENIFHKLRIGILFTLAIVLVQRKSPPQENP